MRYPYGIHNHKSFTVFQVVLRLLKNTVDYKPSHAHTQVCDERVREVPFDIARASGVGQDYRHGRPGGTVSFVEPGRSGGGEIRRRVRVQFVAGADAQLAGRPVGSCGRRPVYLVQTRESTLFTTRISDFLA